MERILLSLVIIFISLSGAVAGSRAFFSDREQSTNNTITAGDIDLKIGNTSYYNGQVSSATSWTLGNLTNQLFFNFNDVKPGDLGEDTIEIKVDTNDAWLCANIALTKNDDNGSNEPEFADGDLPDDPNNDFDGELAQELQFVFWSDDGDNVLEDNEPLLTQGSAAAVLANTTWPLADSQVNTLTGLNGQPLTGSTSYYIGKAWCFGEMVTAPLTQDGVNNVRTPIDPAGAGVTCRGVNVNNRSQTDTMMGDVTFYATQSRNNPNFVCGPNIFITPTPSPTISPTPVACVPVYGNEVVASAQGLKKDNSAITDPTRTNPAFALGTPNNQFFSLGKNGTITIKFASPIANVAGYDLTLGVAEVTNGRNSYPLEEAAVQVSEDGTTWAPLTLYATSEPGGDGVSQLDFDPTGLTSFQYIRLTDATNFAIHDNTADGFDLDAVIGNCQAPIN